MDDAGEVRETLLQLADERRVSLAGLSEMIGRNPTYLQQFVRKGSPRRLAEDDRRRLAEFFDVGEEVLGATGAQVTGTARAKDAAGEWITVPRLQLDASAGPGSFSAEEISFDAIRFSRRWLREMGLADAQLSAIRVEGDSMEPVLRGGDEILVDRTSRALRDGIYVVRLAEVLHVKRVQARMPGRITLISANEAYAPFELALDEVEIVGRVVWKGGKV
ncbi:transcriptional regulator [Altererythrobacter aurantiacus]|uniref:Transcriptional regulator n=1 Tax=Parapontixanthobacter aurantiacus TaxID=1463599 RepID=A0A844ZDU6_9SPHN|nr:S24 family peptidase [Parapontixanthobacter aurantiacus]MXO85704.1 transcriptional regulator [Parapontixanthobacter aurantiacus]